MDRPERRIGDRGGSEMIMGLRFRIATVAAIMLCAAEAPADITYSSTAAVTDYLPPGCARFDPSCGAGSQSIGPLATSSFPSSGQTFTGSFNNVSTGGTTSYSYFGNVSGSGYTLGAESSLSVTNMSSVSSGSPFFGITTSGLSESIIISAPTSLTFTFDVGGIASASGVNYSDFFIFIDMLGVNVDFPGGIGGEVDTPAGVYTDTINVTQSGTYDLNLDLQARVCIAGCGFGDSPSGSDVSGVADYLDPVTLVDVSSSNPDVIVVDASTGAPLPTFPTSAFAPEPTSLALFAAGLAAVGASRRRAASMFHGTVLTAAPVP